MEERGQNWLPEDYTLNLTAFDPRALTSVVLQMEERPEGEVCEPGEDGEIVRTTFKKRFLRKIEEARLKSCPSETNP